MIHAAPMLRPVWGVGCAVRRVMLCSSTIVRSYHLGLAALMLALAVVPANSQTLHQTLAKTYRANPQLDAARATLRATDEDVSKAHSQFRPVISGNSSSSWSRTTTSPSSTTAGTLNSRSVGVTLAQPIFRGFRSLNQLRVAEANVRAGRETLRNTEQLVLLSAVAAHMDVVRDQIILRLNQKNLRALKKQLAASRSKLRVGGATRTDLAQAIARHAGAISNVEVAIANLKASRAKYEEVVSSPPASLKTPRVPLRDLPRSLAGAKQNALRDNPLIANALYLEQAARYGVEEIRGELLPTVSLNSSYTHRRNPLRTLNKSNIATVTANMSVPIYSGGEIEARVRQAKHSHVARIQQIHQVKLEQLQEVVSTWARYAAAKAQRAATAAQVRANRIALAGVLEEHNVGQRTVLDVLNAEQELLTAETAEVSARRDVIVQAYTLLRAIGRLNVQDLALGINTYDPELHYLEVRRKWFGLTITYPDGRKEITASSLDKAPYK